MKRSHELLYSSWDVHHGRVILLSVVLLTSLVRVFCCCCSGLGDKIAECYIYYQKGEFYLQQGEPQDAWRCFEETLKKTEGVRQEVREKYLHHIASQTHDVSSSSKMISRPPTTGRRPQFQSLSSAVAASSFATAAAASSMNPNFAAASMMLPVQMQPVPPSPIIQSMGYLDQERHPPAHRALSKIKIAHTGNSQNIFSALSAASSPSVSRTSVISELTEVDDRPDSFQNPLLLESALPEVISHSSAQTPVFRSCDGNPSDSNDITADRNSDSSPRHNRGRSLSQTSHDSHRSHSSQRMSSFELLSELESPIHRAVEAGSGTGGDNGGSGTQRGSGARSGSGSGTRSGSGSGNSSRSARTRASSRSWSTAAGTAAAAAEATRQSAASPSLSPSDPGITKIRSPSEHSLPRSSHHGVRQSMRGGGGGVPTRSHSHSLSFSRDRASSQHTPSNVAVAASANAPNTGDSRHVSQSSLSLTATSASALASRLASHSFSSATSSSSITTLASHRRSQRRKQHSISSASFSSRRAATGAQSFADVLSGAGRANAGSRGRGQPRCSARGRGNMPLNARPTPAPGSTHTTPVLTPSVSSSALGNVALLPSAAITSAPGSFVGSASMSAHVPIAQAPLSAATLPEVVAHSTSILNQGVAAAPYSAPVTNPSVFATPHVPNPTVLAPSHTTSVPIRVAPMPLNAASLPFVPLTPYSPVHSAPQSQSSRLQPQATQFISPAPLPAAIQSRVQPMASAYQPMPSDRAASLRTYGLHQNTPPPSGHFMRTPVMTPQVPMVHGGAMPLPASSLPSTAPGTPTALMPMPGVPHVGVASAAQVAQLPMLPPTQYSTPAMMPHGSQVAHIHQQNAGTYVSNIVELLS